MMRRLSRSSPRTVIRWRRIPVLIVVSHCSHCSGDNATQPKLIMLRV